MPLSQRGWTLISEFSSLTLFGLVFGAIEVSAVLLIVTSLLVGVPLAWALLFCFTSTFSACGVDWIVFSAFFSIGFSSAGVASVVLDWVVETTGVAACSTSAASAPFWVETAKPAPLILKIILLYIFLMNIFFVHLAFMYPFKILYKCILSRKLVK